MTTRTAKSKPPIDVAKPSKRIANVKAWIEAKPVILKCDPLLAETLRKDYTGVGHRSHLDRRFWIAVQLDSDVPAKEIKRLVSLSYDLVCAGLTAKQRAELAAIS